MAVTRVDPFALSDAEVYHELGRPGVKRLLAEGDSWLSICLPRDGNLMTWLESRHDLVVLDLSYPGDTLAEMAGGRQFELFQRLVADPHHGWQFDAILLNGGGNDLIGGGLERILKKPTKRRRAKRNAGPEDWIDEEALDRLLEELGGYLLRFITTRSASVLNADCPILSSTYDFITPRDCGTQLLGVTLEGPWICPKLKQNGIAAPALQKAITDYLLVSFRKRVLETLAIDEVNNFHLIGTQGTLTPAGADEVVPDGDWADEIHPSARGWAKLARRIGPALDALLD